MDNVIPSGFIELTALFDGRKACIRAACIESVLDNAKCWDGKEKFTPECRTVYYSGQYIRVTESYEDILDAIKGAEL